MNTNRRNKRKYGYYIIDVQHAKRTSEEDERGECRMVKMSHETKRRQDDGKENLGAPFVSSPRICGPRNHDENIGSGR
jgi:hypothetical protein